MVLRKRLVLAALAVSALLALAVGDASAGRFRFSEREFELIWSEAFAGKTKLGFAAGGNNVQCKLTLLGHFVESTIKKETAITQGRVNHGELNECAGGTATLRIETLPWSFRYRGFTGTLPVIRSISLGLIGAQFRIREANGTECEAGTEANHPGVGVVGNSTERAETEFERTGEPEDITAERANKIPLGGGFLCGFAGEGTFSGVGLIRNLPRTAKVRITLI